MENEHPNIPVPLQTYTKNYPALAPLASVENDNPAADINVGMEIRDEHIAAASSQHKARKHLLGLNRADSQEVMASKKRLSGLIIESVSTLPVGQDWADMLAQEMRQGFANVQADVQALREEVRTDVQALQVNVQALQVNVQALQVNVQAMDQRLIAMDQRLIEQSIQTAKLANRTLLLTATDSIVPVPKHDGVLPNNVPGLVVPVTLVDITSMVLVHVEALLDFYDLPVVGLLPEKKAALCSHLGLEQMARAFQNN